jgi:uncharacterized protein YhaN
MKLLTCHIDNFGKLHNFDCCFEDHLMVIAEDNGWGKSTFAAFLRVMFYGFAGSSRRGAEDNERARLRPWQSGIYGGTLTFETQGRVYRIERTFGERPREDTFLLYDETTGLLSEDFGEKIGEALFGIDQESFCRTLYIGQLDCPSSSTAGIQAIMGGKEAADDLVRYESVRGRLQREADRLSPDRPAGRISRRKGDLAALRSRQASVEDLEEACRTTQTRLKREQDALRQLEESGKDIQAALEKKASAHSPGGILDQYSLLLGAQEAAAAEEERLLAFFPEKIPSADDPLLDELIRSRTEKEMTSARLTEVRSALHQRQDALKELDLAVASLEQAYPDLLPQEQIGTEEVPEGTSGPGIWLLVAGMAMLAASFIFLGQIKRNYLIALAVAGLVISAVGSLMMVRLLQIRRRIRRSDEEIQAMEKHSLLLDRREILEEHLRDLTLQEERLTDYLAEYGRKAQAFVTDLGMEVEDDLASQLIRIRSQAGAAARAGARTRKCQEEREAFEKEKDMSDEMIRKALAERQGPSLSDLTMQLSQVTADLEKTRAEAEKDAHSLQALQGKLSQAREAAVEYEKGCRELESLQHRYQVLDRTLFYLEQARNAFHARHKDTFLEAFRIYYEYLSGEKADAFETDAALNVLVRTQGRLRAPSLFSTGCQDLIGLCRRLSMIDAMYRSEKPFLIMDDPFVSLDEERLQAGLRLVRGLSADRQVIYFTCHGGRIP